MANHLQVIPVYVEVFLRVHCTPTVHRCGAQLFIEFRSHLRSANSLGKVMAIWLKPAFWTKIIILVG